LFPFTEIDILCGYMRWIIYGITGCIIYDIIAVQYHISRGTDVFVPGFYVVIFSVILLYTIGVVRLVDKKALFDKSIALSVLLLAPCFIFLLLHALLFVINICSWLDSII
jgi:hypothetical protein